jgi:hypothetical protein
MRTTPHGHGYDPTPVDRKFTGERRNRTRGLKPAVLAFTPSSLAVSLSALCIMVALETKSNPLGHLPSMRLRLVLGVPWLYRDAGILQDRQPSVAAQCERRS